MTRYIMPAILILIAVAVFFVLTNPILGDINNLKEDVVSYNRALDNSKALETERDKLVVKENSISIDNKDKIMKFLPDNVDNIRLILEIEELAKPFGMTLKDVKYNVEKTTTENNNTTTPNNIVASGAEKDYGIFDLEFSTSGTYNNFINFTKTLESNLRMVDISSISFSSDNLAATGRNTGLSTQVDSTEIYKYNFKIKTYWLVN